MLSGGCPPARPARVCLTSSRAPASASTPWRAAWLTTTRLTSYGTNISVNISLLLQIFSILFLLRTNTFLPFQPTASRINYSSSNISTFRVIRFDISQLSPSSDSRSVFRVPDESFGETFWTFQCWDDDRANQHQDLRCHHELSGIWIPGTRHFNDCSKSFFSQTCLLRFLHNYFS